MPKEIRPISFYFSNTGTRATVYTCPQNCRARIISFGADNVTGVTDVTFTAYDDSASTRYQISKPSSFPYITEDAVLILEQGDLFEVACTGTSQTAEGFVTVEETFNPVG